MKTSNWSIVGYIAGAVFGLGSFIRYYIIYPDIDKAITYGIIGLLICAVSWIYNNMLHQSNSITAIEDYLDDKREVGK